MQVQNHVPLSSTFFILAGLPLEDLLELLGLGLLDVQALLRLLEVEDGLDCVVLHVGDNEIIEVLLVREWTHANGVEVDHLVSHVLEDAIERQVVVLAQRQLKEGHLLLVIVALPEFVVEEAAEELYVAALRSDRQRFFVLGSRLVVVVDGLFVGFKRAQEDKQGAYHHACATFSGLAVHDDDWLLDDLVSAVVVLLVVLLHSLQEEGSVQAESEHFLQIGDIVIEEGELARREGRHCLR